jgi:hypothetical protein
MQYVLRLGGKSLSSLSLLLDLSKWLHRPAGRPVCPQPRSPAPTWAHSCQIESVDGGAWRSDALTIDWRFLANDLNPRFTAGNGQTTRSNVSY